MHARVLYAQHTRIKSLTYPLLIHGEISEFRTPLGSLLLLLLLLLLLQSWWLSTLVVMPRA